MADKYNYSEALELLKNAYESGIKVTYKEMEDVLGLEHPIDDKKYASTNNSALYELRNRLKNQYGLTFKSAANGKHSGPEYHYYIISKIKNGNFQKKETVAKEKISQAKSDEYEALSRNNQKLYAEVQRLELENKRLLEMVSKSNSKEEDYKNIIQSLMNIAGIS